MMGMNRLCRPTATVKLELNMEWSLLMRITTLAPGLKTMKSSSHILDILMDDAGQPFESDLAKDLNGANIETLKLLQLFITDAI